MPIDKYEEPGTYTWNKPAGIILVRIKAWGGGGGGGSGQVGQPDPEGVVHEKGGGGGGGGALAISLADVSAETGLGVTVGAGGAAGTNSGDAQDGTYSRVINGAATVLCLATPGSGGGGGDNDGPGGAGAQIEGCTGAAAYRGGDGSERLSTLGGNPLEVANGGVGGGAGRPSGNPDYVVYPDSSVGPGVRSGDSGAGGNFGFWRAARPLTTAALFYGGGGGGSGVQDFTAVSGARGADGAVHIIYGAAMAGGAPAPAAPVLASRGPAQIRRFGPWRFA